MENSQWDLWVKRKSLIIRKNEGKNFGNCRTDAVPFPSLCLRS